jgi:uncharacterized protein
VSFRVPGAQRPGGSRPVVLPRWPRFVIPIVAGVVAAAILIAVVAGIWTDVLWYSSVHQTRVFTTTFSTKWLLFAITAVFMAAVVGSNVWLAYRLRPELPPTGPEHQGVAAYRQAIDPHKRAVMIVLLGLIGLISGLAASGNWQTWLLFVNRVPFHQTDPQFHLDISFYVFVYPFLRTILSFLFAAVLLSLLFAAAVHVLYGGLRLSRRVQPSRGARTQLFVLAAVFVTLKAAAYWVDRYGINFSQRGVVQTGASYTDVHAVLPAKTVLAVIALICAVLFLAGAFRRSSLLAAMGFGLLVLSAVLIGGVYPFIIQQFVVKPNQQAKEAPYIRREIASTRLAYGIKGHTRVQAYPAFTTRTRAQLAQQAAAVPDFRLQDPDVSSIAFQQLQQVKGYYQFAGVLAMDRYIYGSNPLPQDTVVGIRDMAGPPAGQANWVNTHLIYTHGYGFVASTAAQTDTNGNPNFIESNIPPAGALNVTQPRIYFGHEGASYVIVGGRQPELDYPNENAAGQHNTKYQGHGGVSVGSFGNRLLFAIKFRELNILISSAIDSHSRILYIRDPLARVHKVAPFLTLDSDPYPVVVGGRIKWVVDGYTTTDNFPYSRRIGLGQATSNTFSPGGLARGQVNYIRNSVKATVDAYTGAVHLYQWTPSPILTAWMKSFPGLISPRSSIPPELLPHLRYPEVLFDSQRQILAQFHVTNPASFYGGQNFWTVPSDPSILENKDQKQLAGISQPPYYLTLSMPGASSPQFSLTTLFTPTKRPNASAYMAVNSNPTSPDYGKITILQFPQATAIPGPGQVQSNFESFTPASEQLSLLRKGGSEVTQGNLVTVPLGGSLLSVEPVFVAASSKANPGAYPQLQKYLAFYYYGAGGGRTGFASTLPDALAQVFGAGPQAPTTSTGPSGGRVTAQVRAFLAQAETDYSNAQTALKQGNLGLYQTDILAMKAALDQASAAAAAAKTGTSPSPSPTGSPSAKPSASRSP